MKTDAEIQREVDEHLKSDRRTRETDISVAVRDGVVTLNGTVPLYAQKVAAQEAAKRTAGIKWVSDSIEIKPTSINVVSDTEIADSVRRALASHNLPTDVEVVVDDGWVRLTGQVTSSFQRDAAFNAVDPLFGVKGVVNDITLKPKVTTVRDSIENI